MMPSYVITKTVKSKYVKSYQSKIKFTAKDIYSNMLPKQKIIYSIDGKTDTTGLDKTNSFFLTTTKGKHIFQFYYSEDYTEIYTDSIDFNIQTREAIPDRLKGPSPRPSREDRRSSSLECRQRAT